MSIDCMPSSREVVMTLGIWNVLPLRISDAIASVLIITSTAKVRPVCDRAQFIVASLKETGILVASGMMRDQSQQVYDCMADMGCSVTQEWTREDWVTVAFRPPQG